MISPSAKFHSKLPKGREAETKRRWSFKSFLTALGRGEGRSQARVGGRGVLRFAVIRGRADFQGRLFDPKYFRQGANLSFN